MLDNPIWHSLTTRHAALAITHGSARRYPVDVAPFVGVEGASESAGEDVEVLVSPGERVGILSAIPPLGSGWAIAREIEIHQYVWEKGLTKPCEEAVQLGEKDVPAMLELTALVYPAYFREGTARLGDYFGLFADGQLVSMAGIRMAMGDPHPGSRRSPSASGARGGGYQEISAICTHPAHQGQGLGSRLTEHLVHHVQRQGDVAFLHTESDNPAKGMYERVGFRPHQVLPFRVYDRF